MVRISRQLLILALLAFCLLLLGGVFSLFFYLPETSPALKDIGLHMQKTRAVHTTFAFGWIFLASLAGVYHYLEESNLLNEAQIKRAKIHNFLWLLAGIFTFFSFMFGIFSGREYVEYHPLISLLIYLGWILYCLNLLQICLRKFWHQPVYIHFWLVGSLFFLVTYFEGHLWYFTNIFNLQIADMQIQWKSIGTLVGALNMLVYGCGIYLAEKISGDKAYAQSKTSFFLFWISLLNSFTNYTHHTYHLPQNHLVKWIGFLVGMLEVFVLVKVLSDLLFLLKKKTATKQKEVEVFLFYSKGWTIIHLSVAIIISIPPLNSLIHGTYVVMFHAMGAMIGIDSFILFALCSWILHGRGDAGVHSKFIPLLMPFLSLSLFIFLISLIVFGTAAGASVFVIFGLISTALLGFLVVGWLYKSLGRK